jgi:glycosyltransferase involved in cell wall biosynthesis
MDSKQHGDIFSKHKSDVNSPMNARKLTYKVGTFFYLWSELGILKTLARYTRAIRIILFKELRAGENKNSSKSGIPMVKRSDLDFLLGSTKMPTSEGDVKKTTNEWVWATPVFGKGSGGHHDIFMLANAAKKIGINQRIGLTNSDFPLDITHFRNSIRDDYGYANLELDELNRSKDYLNELVVATGWQTFAPAMHLPAKKRAYLVQDYEPWFNPVGIQSYLAEQTYKFGVPCITAGPWLAHLMSTKYGAQSEYFDLGYDPEIYKDSGSNERNSIVIYYRPGTLRRASEFTLEVIRSVENEISDFEVHFVGGVPRILPKGNVTVHGSLDHSQLSELYQKAAVTFVLSMTNTSLVPVEALAAGSSVLSNAGEINEMNLAGTSASLVDLNIQKLGTEIVRLANEMNSDKANQNAKSVRGREWDVQSQKAIDFLQELPYV